MLIQFTAHKTPASLLAMLRDHVLQQLLGAGESFPPTALTPDGGLVLPPMAVRVQKQLGPADEPSAALFAPEGSTVVVGSRVNGQRGPKPEAFRTDVALEATLGCFQGGLLRLGALLVGVF